MIRTSVKEIPRFSREYMSQAKDFDDLLWNRKKNMQSSKSEVSPERKRKKKKKSKEKNASESEDVQNPEISNARRLAKKKSKNRLRDAEKDSHHVTFSEDVLRSESSRIPSFETEHLEIPSKKKKKKKRSLENCEVNPDLFDQGKANLSSQLTSSESEVPKKKHKSKKHKPAKNFPDSTEVSESSNVQQVSDSELRENDLESLQLRTPSKKKKKRSEKSPEDRQLPVSDNEVLSKSKKHKSKKRKHGEDISETRDSNSPSNVKPKASRKISSERMLEQLRYNSNSSEDFEIPIKIISQSDGARLLTPRDQKSNSKNEAESRVFKENRGNVDSEKQTAAPSNSFEDSSDTPNKSSKRKSKSPISNQKSNIESNIENEELSKENNGNVESVDLSKSPDNSTKTFKETSKRQSKSPVSHRQAKSPDNNRKLNSKENTQVSEDLDKSQSVEVHPIGSFDSDCSQAVDSPARTSEKLPKKPEKKKAPKRKSKSSKVTGSTEETVKEIVENTEEIDSWLESIKDNLIGEELDFDVSPLHEKFPLLKGLNKDQRQELTDSGIPCRLRAPWSRNEDDILKRNMMEFQKMYEVPSIPFVLGINANAIKRPRAALHKFLKQKKFTFFLGKGLDTRTLNNIYKRAQFLYHPMKTEYPRRKTMSKDELDTLFRLQTKVGNKWNTISELMQKPGNNLYNTAKYYANKRDTGPWTDEENASLLKAVKRYMKQSEDGQHKRLPWRKICKRMGTRTSEQCRNHWLHVLCWKFNHGDLEKPNWSKEDTVKLIALLYESNATTEREVDWDQLHQRFKCTASYGAVLLKWYNLKKQIPNVHEKDFEDNVLYLREHYGKRDTDIQSDDEVTVLN